MDAVRFDLRWQYALDLPVDPPASTRQPSSASALGSCFTARSGSPSTARSNLAKGLGLLDESSERIVDSTPMLGAAAVQDTATLVRTGVRS